MPAQKVLISFKNVSLSIPYYSPRDRKILSNPLRLLGRLYKDDVKRKIKHVIKDLSFELLAGDRIALIGSNGAGKSSLLRLIGGIYPESAGQIQVNGKARGIFDVAMGFSDEATGLENIYLRCGVLGYDTKSLNDLVPKILEFADLGEQIHDPMAIYSTGMRLRLALSIATIKEPDILLLDEWIGAGDKVFNQKIRERMHEIVSKSRGLVIASHNEAILKSICNRAMYIKKGELAALGSVEEVLSIYHKDIKIK